MSAATIGLIIWGALLILAIALTAWFMRPTKGDRRAADEAEGYRTWMETETIKKTGKR